VLVAVFFPIASILIFWSISLVWFFRFLHVFLSLGPFGHVAFSVLSGCSWYPFWCSLAARGIPFAREIPFGAPLLQVKLNRLGFVFVVCHFSGLTPADAFTPSTNTCVTLHHPCI
jgi:hypothetical protein